MKIARLMSPPPNAKRTAPLPIVGLLTCKATPRTMIKTRKAESMNVNATSLASATSLARADCLQPSVKSMCGRARGGARDGGQ